MSKVTHRHRDSRVIPFYGSSSPHLFEIERRCMDRDGRVLDFLNEYLPDGLVLDIGAGNGFTASKLSTAQRTVVALEPDEGMVDSSRPLVWARGVAQEMPFHSNVFDAAYATWAFFFDSLPGTDDGLREVSRVVKSGGMFFMVDNAGDDEFMSLAAEPEVSEPTWWRARGFDSWIIETSFRFDSLEEANSLLRFYFGDRALANQLTEISYRVAVYGKRLSDSDKVAPLVAG